MIFLLCAALSVQGCSFFRGESGAGNASPTPFAAEEIKSAIPFSTKEPETYQTEIVVTANGVEDKIFTARNGERRLTVFNFQTESETRVLHLADGQSFLIAPGRKIYAPRESVSESESANDFLTAELLNQKTGANFERLGAESGFMKYRVHLDETANSEIIVSVDEKIGLPVKQEFYSTRDGQQILTSTVELRNFNLQAEEKFFEVPKNFQKVSTKEFYENLRRERKK